MFCVEAAGELGEGSLVVARGAHAFVLLNKFPYSSGHVMVAPLRHVGEHGHEVRVARPPRDDVLVQVRGDRSAGDLP